jgi:succinoglycan biosynthesis protein ExoV
VILHHWQGHAPNFGDELNTRLWPLLLPGFFDGEPDARFLGIGSILDDRHPSACMKIVAGAGYAGYERKPLIDHTWVIHWVRGPLTAAALGLPSRTALGDPATLLPEAMALGCPSGQPTTCGFMPHFESLDRGQWARAAALAGITLIDPRDPPEAIIEAISRCRVLLSESLHGAIVADTLRVPWIAVRPLAPIHRRKWRDWAETVGVTIRPRLLPASSGAEWLSVSPLARLHRVRKAAVRYRAELDALWPERRLAAAVDGLRQAAGTSPQLSDDRALDRCKDRMMEAIAALRRHPFQGFAGAGNSAGVAAGLRQPDHTGYKLSPAG